MFLPVCLGNIRENRSKPTLKSTDLESFGGQIDVTIGTRLGHPGIRV